MFKIIILAIALLMTSNLAAADSGAGLSIKSVYYCGNDFSMKMSNDEKWVVRKSDVGGQKLSHFISMAMYMLATGKSTMNVFPGSPVDWCGSANVRPIDKFSFEN